MVVKYKKKNNKIINSNAIWVFWLFLVILWNFGFPRATPIEDVIVAVVLSLISILLKKKS